MQAELKNNPVYWALDHLSLVGWPTIVYSVWRIARFLTSVENRALTAEANLIKLTTNDLPHVSSALEGIHKSNESIDRTLKNLVDKMPSPPKPRRKRS